MQSKRQSAWESTVNLMVGMGVALMLQTIIFPLYGHAMTFDQNVEIMLIFTVASWLRSYSVRRYFNWKHRNKQI